MQTPPTLIPPTGSAISAGDTTLFATSLESGVAGEFAAIFASFLHAQGLLNDSLKDLDAAVPAIVQTGPYGGELPKSGEATPDEKQEPFTVRRLGAIASRPMPAVEELAPIVPQVLPQGIAEEVAEPVKAEVSATPMAIGRLLLQAVGSDPIARTRQTEPTDSAGIRGPYARNLEWAAIEEAALALWESKPPESVMPPPLRPTRAIELAAPEQAAVSEPRQPIPLNLERSWEVRTTDLARLQPYQASPFSTPRFLPVAAPIEPKDQGFTQTLVKEGLTVSPERLTDGAFAEESRAFRTEPFAQTAQVVVDREVIRTVDNLLGRLEASELVERGLSVLTRQELANKDSTVQDRSATALARVDRVEFVQRIMHAMERARAEFPKTIEVELHPPALGKVRLRVGDEEGELVARIQVQSNSTRSLLLEHLPNLDRQLGEHGVQIQRFQVDPMNTGWSGGNPDGSAATADQHPPPGQGRPDAPDVDMCREDADRQERGPPISIEELLQLVEGMDRLV